MLEVRNDPLSDMPDVARMALALALATSLARIDEV